MTQAIENAVLWEGLAQAFCKRCRDASRFIANRTGHQSALSMYGVRGYGSHYSDYLSRFDAAIAELEKAKVILMQAEDVRQKLTTPPHP